MAGRTMKASAAADKVAMIRTKEEPALDADDQARAAAVRDVLKAVKPATRKKGPVQPLRPFAADPARAASDGQAYFAKREMGIVLSEEEAKISADHQYDDLRPDLPDADLAVVTTKRILEGSFGKAPAHRAAGEDTLAGELYARNAGVLADLYHPLFVKSELLIKEPWGWKGGLLETFVKAPSIVPSYEDLRAIMVEDVTAKRSHSLHRGQALPALLDIVHTSQQGGMPGRSTTTASHKLRTFLRIQRWRKQSAAIMVVDAVTAFYALVRQMVLHIPRTEEAVLAVCRDLKLGDVATGKVQQRMRQPPAAVRLGLADHLNALMTEAHRGTWFRYRGTGATVAATKRGCRPGDPWADYLYNLLMVEVLQDVTQGYLDQGLLVLFNGQPLQAWEGIPAEALSDITFMDDIALVAEGGTPDQAPQNGHPPRLPRERRPHALDRRCGGSQWLAWG